MHFPIHDACERSAADSPTEERINHLEVIIYGDDDKSDNEPAACGNRHQTTEAIDLDGGQQGASFPEQNERKSSLAADVGDRLSLCKVLDIYGEPSVAIFNNTIFI